MTDSKTRRGALRKVFKSRKLLRLVAGIALVALVLLVLELSRWHSLPAESFPNSETGQLAGSTEATAARQSTSEWLTTVPVTGLSVCVGIAGSAEWCTSSGYADVESGEVLTSVTSMRLGSVSKPVTSILLSRLVEQNLVDFDQPIGEILPSLPKHYHLVTPRQLASHTAGVRPRPLIPGANPRANRHQSPAFSNPTRVTSVTSLRPPR